MKKIFILIILILFIGGCNDKTTSHEEQAATTDSSASHSSHGEITDNKKALGSHGEKTNSHGVHQTTGNSSDITSVIDNRSSVRRYSDVQVDFNTIEEVLARATKAPSAGDLQAYKIYVVTNDKVRHNLTANAMGQYSVYSAPHTLVFVALPKVSGEKYSVRGEKLFCIQDATNVAAYTQLLLQNAGLSSLWISTFRPEGVRKTLELKKDEIPVVIMPFGHPDNDRVHEAERKPVAEVIKYLTD